MHLNSWITIHPLHIQLLVITYQVFPKSPYPSWSFTTTCIHSCSCSPCSPTSSGDGEVVEQVISQQTAEHEEVTIRRSSLLDEAIRQLREQQDRQNQPGREAGPGAGAGPEGQAEAQGPALAPAPSTPRRGINTAPVFHWIVLADVLISWAVGRLGTLILAVRHNVLKMQQSHLLIFVNFPSLQCLWTSEQMCSHRLTWVCAAVDRWRACGRCTRMLLAAKWLQRETYRPGDAGWWSLNCHPAATGKNPVAKGFSTLHSGNIKPQCDWSPFWTFLLGFLSDMDEQYGNEGKIEMNPISIL